MGLQRLHVPLAFNQRYLAGIPGLIGPTALDVSGRITDLAVVFGCHGRDQRVQFDPERLRSAIQQVYGGEVPDRHALSLFGGFRIALDGETSLPI